MTTKNILYIGLLILQADQLSTAAKSRLKLVETEKAEEETKDNGLDNSSMNLEFIYIFIISLRMLLNVLAIKWRKICRITVYIELILTVVASCMPIDTPVEREALLLVGTTVLNFLMSYMSWKRDILLSLLSLIPFYVVRSFSHEDDSIGLLAGLLTLSMLWLTLVLFLSHMTVVKIGTIFTENEVLRNGNEQFMQNLEERVVIFQENSTSVIF